MGSEKRKYGNGRLFVSNKFVSLGPITEKEARQWRGLAEGMDRDFGIDVSVRGHSPDIDFQPLLDLRPHEKALIIKGDPSSILPYLQRLEASEERRRRRANNRLSD
jgi:hypothetical protein